MESKPCLNLTLTRMKPRQSVDIPFEQFKTNSVRNAASLKGRELGRTFSVSVDWDGKCSKVTRTA